MELKSQEIIGRLEVLNNNYKEYQAEVSRLISNQEKVIDELIEKNRPIFEWLRNNTDFYFTHPTLSYKSSKGPILGYQEEDHRLIVYDVDNKRIVVTDIGEKDAPDKTMITYQLVNNGHFTTTVEGLNYLEEMLESYVEGITKYVEKLKYELTINE